MEKTNISLHKQKKTRLSAIFAVILCTGLVSFAQLMLKIGSARLSFGFLALLSNVPLMLGASAYILGFVIFIMFLKYGELSVLYPIFALSYIWVNLLSAHFLGEALNGFKWAGIASIILGVFLISWGRNK